MIEDIKVTDLDLDHIKDYLRVDIDDDDVLLRTMLSASRSFIQSYLKRKFSEFEEEGELPQEFTIAALSIISHWYENRTIHSNKDTRQELSYVFSGLLDMHRNWN